MRIRKILATLALIVIFSTVFLIPSIIVTHASSGRRIDLFTQKEPFSGKGLNESSDSFQPQEEVILYALVTYNDAPVQSKYVAFQVNRPSPPTVLDPIVLIRASMTNESGIASISFRIPTPVENEEEKVIGEWVAIATVDIAGVTVIDTLTFNVDYGVKITDITILNSKLTPQTAFLRQETVVFSITAENTGMTSKIATVSIDVEDSAKIPIIHIELNGLILNSGENKIQASSQVPINSKIGEATVWVVAHTASPNSGGVPYSPPTSTTFMIITRDIAITSISLSTNIIKIGDSVNIIAHVKNKGNETESFYVSIFYNQTLLMKKYITALLPSMEIDVEFSWKTLGVQEGTYIITGVADPVDGEIETHDNTLKDGAIKVLPSLPLIVHDVAVTYLNIQPSVIQLGQLANIMVQVKNFGSVPESFNVTLFYDNFQLTVLKVSFLAPGASTNLSYIWDTSQVMEGNYTIKASIPPVEGEENIANNQLVDGKVWIKAPQIPVKKHDVAIVDLAVSKNLVYKGEKINVTVLVANFGDFDETFSVFVYANMSEIWSYRLTAMKAGSNKIISFILDTAYVDVGNYTLWAKAEYINGETNTENNILINGVVKIRSLLPYQMHDIAVIKLSTGSQSVFAGEKITIIVTVKNYGNTTESFNLTLFYNLNVIKKTPIYSLLPNAERTIAFEWDTSNVEEGTYTLSAYAEPVSGETNIDNNRLVDGTITVMNPLAAIRDVAIAWLSAEPSEVEAGKNFTIKFTVLNLGNISESFNVTVYYGYKLIDEVSVISLNPYTVREITLQWNTEGVDPGTYTLSANATILFGELNVENNKFVDGEIIIKPAFVFSYLIFVIPFLTGLAIILLLLLAYYWRKKREAVKPAPRFIIINHPHI